MPSRRRHTLAHAHPPPAPSACLPPAAHCVGWHPGQEDHAVGPEHGGHGAGGCALADRSLWLRPVCVPPATWLGVPTWCRGQAAARLCAACPVAPAVLLAALHGTLPFGRSVGPVSVGPVSRTLLPPPAHPLLVPLARPPLLAPQSYDYHLSAVNTVTFIDQNRRFVSTSGAQQRRGRARGAGVG